MGILKPVLILAILSSALLCNNAWATEPPPRVGSVPDEAKPAATPAVKAPAKAAPAAPAKKPVKRRAVRQILGDDIVRSAAPPPYGPTLTPPVGVQPIPMPALNVPGGQPLPMPAAPSNQIQSGGCSGGICTDANGALYHGGVGTTLLSPQGRLCSNNGVTVQCF